MRGFNIKLVLLVALFVALVAKAGQLCTAGGVQAMTRLVEKDRVAVVDPVPLRSVQEDFRGVSPLPERPERSAAKSILKTALKKPDKPLAEPRNKSAGKETAKEAGKEGSRRTSGEIAKGSAGKDASREGARDAAKDVARGSLKETSREAPKAASSKPSAETSRVSAKAPRPTAGDQARPVPAEARKTLPRTNPGQG